MNFNNKTLTIKQVSEYLLKNEEKYNETQKPIKCLSRTLPCMCFVRDKDCLFIDIYEKLTEKYSHYLDEKHLEDELKKYNEIVNDTEKVKVWLTKNLQIGFSKFSWFSTANKYSDLKLSFINGKNETEFEYIKFQIDGNNFKNNYDFAHLFCELFFDKEFLPNELAKWKYENNL
jgi:hypothetical protein